MRADRKDPNIAALRRFKPTKFTATLRDGTARELVLSTRANKWEILADTLGALPWDRIEALDGTGAVLGVVDREREEAGPDDGDDYADEPSDVAKYVAMMKDVQLSTLHEARLMFADRDRRDATRDAAVTESIHAMKEAYEAMADGYQMTIKMTAMAAGTEGEGGDKTMQMMQMAAMLMSKQAPSAVVPPRPQVPERKPRVIPIKPAGPKPA